MSTQQLASWLKLQNQSVWDTKVAEWLKRTQGRALKEQSAKSGRSQPAAAGSGEAKARAKPAPKPTSTSQGKQEAKALTRLKEDLIELENYVPWNAVVSSWGSKRGQWGKKLEECTDVASIARHLATLEQALLAHSLEPEWRASNRDEWTADLLKESSAQKVRGLLREMEESIRWTAFAKQGELHEGLKKLLGTPGGALLKDAIIDGGDGIPSTIKTLRLRIEQFECSSFADLVSECRALATGSSNPVAVLEGVNEVLGAAEAEEAEEEAEGDDDDDEGEAGMSVDVPTSATRKRGAAASSPKGASGAGMADSPRGEAEMSQDLKEGLHASGAKRSRMMAKEAKFEQFKKQQQLHPEYAGVYAETLIEKQEMHQYQELRVFRGRVDEGTIVGILHFEPHTTLRELRRMLQTNLGFDCDNPEEELSLSRGSYDPGGEDATEPIDGLLCPIPLTQNHKVVHTLFPRPRHVLVVQPRDERPLSDEMLDSVRRRALEGEEILTFDLSRGHERQPIPVFNGADGDPSPDDFTYVTECVVNEGLRLLLGGPLRDPWTCPYVESGTQKAEEMAYTADSKFLHKHHTIDSVYECTLASGCGLDCKNRMVQRGPQYRLEVIRCMEKEGRFVKGWGVRSPDFVPRGSFLCEYIGEYISDDEAEMRGIKYDDQNMSRLMDVVGDGKDVVRMCIDATHFSNLGRFLNHSCDPNVFKQRVFCDHNSRLPRIAFFALRDIQPLEELAYDYGYADVPGKTMPCMCGADNCQKLLY
jgi:hypothetical protein